MLKALLTAMLEPTEKLRQMEAAGDYTARLATLEELKTLPVGAVWDQYCQQQSVPLGSDWIGEVKHYETSVLAKRK
jgi:L-rhamnose isomerase